MLDGPLLTAIIAFRWRPLGVLVAAADRLLFPVTPTAPGVYRFVLPEGRGYVGEAANLRRRFNGYRNPGTTQQTNLRMHPVLLAADAEDGVAISTVTAATLTIGSATSDLDLTLKANRRLVENTAIAHAAAEGVVLLNLP